MLQCSLAGAHKPALPLQPAWAPSSPGGRSCLASFKAAPSDFWKVGEWGPALTPRPGQDIAWARSKVPSPGHPVLVVRHPAKQRSNHPDVIHNLPVL